MPRREGEEGDLALLPVEQHHARRDVEVGVAALEQLAGQLGQLGEEVFGVRPGLELVGTTLWVKGGQWCEKEGRGACLR